MAFKFNPFTRNLDLVGSGGGASYIDGVADTAADLPVTQGNPPLDAVFVVKQGSGIWLINRKPAGLYCRIADNGNLDDWQYLGAFPEVNADGNWALYNSTDPSKELKFDVSGVSASTVRTLTVPDANGTIARTEDFAAPPAIGNTTPAAGSFTTLNSTSLVVTNTNTFTVNANDSFAATGFASIDAVRLLFKTGGTARAGITGGGEFFTTGTLRVGGTGGAALHLDATNILAQRDGTNPQTFNVYNTFTSATNHERGFLKWSSNVFQIGTEKGSGGGTARNIEFLTDNTVRGRFQAEGLVVFGGVFIGNSYIDGQGESNFSLRLIPFSGGNCILTAGLFKFHGTTSSFPALKRNSTTLEVRLANDSAFAPLSCGALTLNGNLDASTRDIVTDTTTGTKIGTATTQKIGFFNATPVVQQAAVADATDAASTQDRLNDLLARLRTLGLIAT